MVVNDMEGDKRRAETLFSLLSWAMEHSCASFLRSAGICMHAYVDNCVKSMTVYDLQSQRSITLYKAAILIHQYYIRTLLSVRWQEGEKTAVARLCGFAPICVCVCVCLCVCAFVRM